MHFVYCGIWFDVDYDISSDLLTVTDEESIDDVIDIDSIECQQNEENHRESANENLVTNSKTSAAFLSNYY